jgi:tRNA(Ile)-lysidine synthase
MNLTEKIKQTVLSHDMLPAGCRVLLAVSGGPDSVLLLHWFEWFIHSEHPEWGQGEGAISFCAAHLNHSIRKAAPRDEQFVRSLCRRLKVPFFSATCDVPELAAKSGMSIEEAGREARYAFLRETAQAEGCSRIAIGHNSDDVIETFLMRIFAGTGLEGLSSIRPVNGNLIRPLIDCSGREIRDYVRKNRLAHVTDRTNYDTGHPRNLLRHRVLPLIRKSYKEYSGNILNLIEIIRAENEPPEARTLAFISEHVLKEKDRTVFSCSAFLGLDTALRRRVLHKLLTFLGHIPSFGLISHIVSALAPQGGQVRQNRIIVSDTGIRVAVKADEVSIEKASGSGRDADEPLFFSAQHPGTYEMAGTSGLHVSLEEISVEDLGPEGLKDPSYMHLDAEQVSWPLVIRARSPGDRISMLGTGHSRKVQDIMVDLKIPEWERNSVPVAVSGKIVAGLFFNLVKPGNSNYISHALRVTEKTRKVLKIGFGMHPVQPCAPGHRER